MRKVIYFTLSIIMIIFVISQIIKDFEITKENKQLFEKIATLENTNQQVSKQNDWQSSRIDVIEKKLEEYKNAGGMVPSTILDQDISENVLTIVQNIESYYDINKTFKNYVLSDTMKQSYRAYMQGCPVEAQVLIDPNGDGYTIYQQFCSNAGGAYCAERHSLNTEDIAIVTTDTEHVKATKRCN